MAFAAASLSSVLWFVPSEAVFWSPDEGGRYLDLRRIVETHRYRNSLPYPGRELDPELRHVPLIYHLEEDGEIESWWPSAFPALSSIPFVLFGTYGLYLVPIFSTLAVSGVVLFLVGASRRGAVAFALCALATPLAFYSFTFWEHTLAALLSTLAFASAAVGRERRGLFYSGLSGAVLALATFVRIEAALGLAAVGLSMWLWRKRPAVSNLAMLVATYGVLVAPLAVARDGEPSYLDRHYRLAQRFLEAPHRGRQPSALDLAMGNAMHGGVSLSSSWKVIGGLAGLLSFFAPFWFRRRVGWLAWVGTAGLSVVCLRALSLATPYVSVHGLLLVAPFTVLSGWSLFSPGRKPNTWGTLSVSGVAAYGIASVLLGWEAQGGLQWGPRYALIFVPAVVIATFESFDRLRGDEMFSRRFVVVSFVALYAAGFGFQLRGIQSLLFAKRTFASWQTKIAELPDDALLLTKSPVVALSLPEIYRTRVLLRVDELSSIPAGLFQRAEAAGFREVCALTGFETGDLVASCRRLESE